MTPYEPNNDSTFTFIDLFAGVGGIRLPFQVHGGKCMFTSELDKYAQCTYKSNYGEEPLHGDITKVQSTDIPDHDILLGGFPCQAFSQAGLQRGFDDTRGTLFFEIQRILADKRPKAFLLENVKKLKTHDSGKTFKTIIDILTGEYNEHSNLDDVNLSSQARDALSQKLNYSVHFTVLRARDFGVPQNRERIFIVGFDKDYFGDLDFDSIFKFPKGSCTKTRVGDILQSQEELDQLEVLNGRDAYTLSDKLWSGHQARKAKHIQNKNGFGYTMYDANSEYTNTLSARYGKDGSEILIDQSHLGKNPRKLTPRECARLQGFPEDFVIDAVSHTQIYKELGNSVCVKVIDAISTELLKTLEIAEKLRKENNDEN